MLLHSSWDNGFPRNSSFAFVASSDQCYVPATYSSFCKAGLCQVCVYQSHRPSTDTICSVRVRILSYFRLCKANGCYLDSVGCASYALPPEECLCDGRLNAVVALCWQQVTACSVLMLNLLHRSFSFGSGELQRFSDFEGAWRYFFTLYLVVVLVLLSHFCLPA